MGHYSDSILPFAKAIDFSLAAAAKEMSIYIGEFASQEEELTSDINPEQQNHYTAKHSIGKKLIAELKHAISDEILKQQK